MEIEKNTQSTDGGAYAKDGSSEHYKITFFEYMRSVELKYGTVIACFVAFAQADKYAYRAGLKKEVSVDKDIMKRDWYLGLALSLKDKIEGKDVDSNTYRQMSEEVWDLIKQGEEEYELKGLITLNDLANAGKRRFK
jgi:hypothetical protein